MDVTVTGSASAPHLGDAVARAVRATLEAENVPEEVEVGVALVEEAAMIELNGRYRGLPEPTDVLAFACEAIDEERPGGAEIALGDLAICPEVASRQAEAQGHAVEAELELLAVHGTLHLVGYEHDTEASAKEMEDREAVILADLKARGKGRG